MPNNQLFDVIIIGESYAGLSAAMTLGRSLRSTLVIDAGQPCNQQTPHSHNFLTQDGKTPAEISSIAKEQVQRYSTVEFIEDFAISGQKVENEFQITTQSQQTYRGKKLIFATGIKDQLPDIPGFAECWGISVIHCPYCHGYEAKSKKTGVMANGERAMHYAPLIKNLTNELAFLTNGGEAFANEQTEKLLQHNIQIIDKEISEVNHHNGYVHSISFSDGSQEPFEAVYASVPFIQHSEIPTQLGCELTEQGYLKISPMQETSIPGIYACGDNSNPMRSVANAVATGNMTGAVVNKHLADEEF
ncbi:MAG: pyridine nucleotide-disulfide oxidoreductase [Flammeovirgaceae bacterium]|nr:pyridine nucleotide-disulfide oxidoreductase [Flammeovirgaceae bacterium]HCX22701.1 pyridine nucleotide-disulfide oxidoreductase [Cytophagales bacterium]|tara:strand:- start:5616 stop:6524 length:909 start_codon:yes stop_codon:yes gene_type:complete